MSSSTLPLHPPYAVPITVGALATVPLTPDAFAASAIQLLPYVPPDARLAAATARVDVPDVAPLVAGGRVDTPLFVPTLAEEPEQALPSIDEFLLEAPADGGAATMAALFAAPAEPTIDHQLDEAIEAAADSALRSTDEMVAAEADESWALVEASEALSELADGLTSRGGTSREALSPEVREVPPEPLEPWTDEERWMDIMPALQTPGGPALAGETAWARAFAEPPAPMTPPALPAGDTEAAAASLEAIARRLRAGELEVPGFRGDRGDAAALAAALAALLGARG